MIMKSIVSYMMLVLLTSCSTAVTHVTKPIDTSSTPTVALRIGNDTEKLSENISRRIQTLGFKIISDGHSQPDYYANVVYSTYWDVVHQTFTHFEIAFVSSKTNEAMIRSEYVGRIGFNDCNAALDIVFKDLLQKLRQNT